MASRIYITGRGADPAAGRPLADPIFHPVATLGACMPNVRRHVEREDWVFVVSGRTQSLPQYIIGGFQVADKISALEAYVKFPAFRLHLDNEGRVAGNIAVDETGAKHPLDRHAEDGFERRAQNYLVGGKSYEFARPVEVERSRRETLGVLRDLRGRDGNRAVDIIGRGSGIDPAKLPQLLAWMESVKSER